MEHREDHLPVSRRSPRMKDVAVGQRVTVLRALVDGVAIRDRARAHELVEEGAKRALSDLKAVAPYDPGKPCEIKVEYKGTSPPQKLRFQAGVETVDDRTIVSRADDWWSAWKQFFFAAH